MQAISKLLYLLTFLGVSLNVLASPQPRASSPRLKSICDLSHDNISLVIPSDINDGQAKPLLAPIADHPTFVLLSVGAVNYTCQANGTWLSYGALTELFDISCIVQEDRAAFTTLIYNRWLAAPDNYTALDLVQTADLEYAPYAIGQHYWVPDPLNETDGTTNPKWDFGSTEWHGALEGAADPETAYLISYWAGVVPAPNDPDVNIQWVALAPLIRDGAPLGLFADQVFRINTHGGAGPTSSCVPGGPIAQSKAVVEFWYYGGYWSTH